MIRAFGWHSLRISVCGPRIADDWLHRLLMLRQKVWTQNWQRGFRIKEIINQSNVYADY